MSVSVMKFGSRHVSACPAKPRGLATSEIYCVSAAVLYSGRFSEYSVHRANQCSTLKATLRYFHESAALLQFVNRLTANDCCANKYLSGSRMNCDS